MTTRRQDLIPCSSRQPWEPWSCGCCRSHINTGEATDIRSCSEVGAGESVLHVGLCATPTVAQLWLPHLRQSNSSQDVHAGRLAVQTSQRVKHTTDTHENSHVMPYIIRITCTRRMPRSHTQPNHVMLSCDWSHACCHVTRSADQVTDGLAVHTPQCLTCSGDEVRQLVLKERQLQDSSTQTSRYILDKQMQETDLWRKQAGEAEPTVAVGVDMRAVVSPTR